MTSGKPDFATNQDGARVAGALNALLGLVRLTLAEPPDLAIATAYFNPGGYALLAEELDSRSATSYRTTPPSPHAASPRCAATSRAPWRSTRMT